MGAIFYDINGPYDSRGSQLGLQRQLQMEQQTLASLKSRWQRATKPLKRDRFGRRVQKCEARIVALMLSHP